MSTSKISEKILMVLWARAGGRCEYETCDKNLTIETALNNFYLNRRLQIIIITEHGELNERPLGVVTIADILDMNAIIENY